MDEGRKAVDGKRKRRAKERTELGMMGRSKADD